jgi:hypothetical protein
MIGSFQGAEKNSLGDLSGWEKAFYRKEPAISVINV